MNKKHSAAERARVIKLLCCFENEPDDFIFWSFRYFLGRMTIATCAFAQDLAKAWEYLNDRTKEQIKKELEQAFERDDEMRADEKCSGRYYPLGMDCDRKAWELVRNVYNKI